MCLGSCRKATSKMRGERKWRVDTPILIRRYFNVSNTHRSPIGQGRRSLRPPILDSPHISRIKRTALNFHPAAVAQLHQTHYIACRAHRGLDWCRSLCRHSSILNFSEIIRPLRTRHSSTITSSRHSHRWRLLLIEPTHSCRESQRLDQLPHNHCESQRYF